jgi:hypothetical protein
LRILPCLWRTSNLPKPGKLESEAVGVNVGRDLGHDAISDRVDDVVGFASRAEIQHRTDSRSDRFTSDLRDLLHASSRMMSWSPRKLLAREGRTSRGAGSLTTSRLLRG